MLTVFLLRHASHGLLGAKLAGRMPGVGLSAAGRAEAERLAERLAGAGIGRIVSSPLDRALETAAPLARRVGLAVDVSDALNEIDCGAWTGMDFSALGEDPRWRVWNEERAHAAPPGGEAMAAVQDRAAAYIEALATTAGESDGAVALVTHGDVIKAAVCAVLGLSLDRVHAFAVDPASITTLRFWGAVGEVTGLNEAAP